MKYQLIKERDPLLSPIEQIFYNRGISLQEIQNFINPTENSLVTPLKFDNILEGFKILLKHIKNWDKVYLQVDCDADGMTSAAILINYLHRRFPIWVDNCLSYHFHKGKEHGIELNEVSDDIKLVIAPDASSNEFDIHKQLYDKGVDVLILDHHKAEEVSQWACVINNQLCDYPNKTLSGAGVVYKFCAFMDNYFEVPYAQDFLDLASLGIIADVMNLTNLETRYIISKGLSNIQNPFFKEMVHMQSYNLQDGVTPSGVGWYISPYINAMMRSGTQEEKKLMFEAMLESKAYTNIPSTKRGASIGEEELLVEQAVRVASRVKDRQNKERDKFYKEVAQTIADENLNKDQIIVVALDDCNENLRGLIANKVMGDFHKPTMILDDNGMGSARGISEPQFDDFRGYCLGSEYINWAEGHNNAFGVSVNDVSAFVEEANEALKDVDFDSSTYKVDFIIDESDLDSSLLSEVSKLDKCWGNGFEEATFAIEGINVTSNNIQLMSPDKHPTLKIITRNGVQIIKFKSSEEEYESLCSDGCVTINIVGTCAKNVWNNRVSYQILVQDYEVVDRQEYYF